MAASRLLLALTLLACFSSCAGTPEKKHPIAARPRDTGGWLIQADDHLRSGNYTAARADAEELIRHNPESWVGYLMRAKVYAGEGDSIRALGDCAEAIRMAPQAPQPFLARAEIYAGMGQTGKALEDCERALNLQPQYPQARDLQAKLLGQQPGGQGVQQASGWEQF